MKKTKFVYLSKFFLFFALIATIYSNPAQAQTSGNVAAFVKGSKTIGFSIGFGVNYNYYGGYASTPAFAFTYDQGFFDNVGPGTIGIGGIVAIKSAHYNYPGGMRASWDDFIIGVRGTYHLTLLKDMNNQFDPYAGVMFGFRVENFKDNYYQQSSSTVNPAAGIFVGAKYNFAEHFGAFAELGYDISNARIGINVNF
jgi:hypothetical protein